MGPFETEVQRVTLLDFPAEGLILDIGGGGSGIIGRLKGEQVVSIDNRIGEFKDANNTAFKLHMDGEQLSFADGQFHKATAFFSLMYMPNEVKEKVLREVYRVLRDEGILYIWDTKIDAAALAGKKEAFIIHLSVLYPNGDEVCTGYGVSLKNKQQDAGSVAEMASRCGFELVKKVVNEYVFFLKLQKR